MSQRFDHPAGAAAPAPVNMRSLDALRGVLAMFVVGHHARWLLWMGYENWARLPHPAWQKLLALATVPFRFGHEAVMVFFVLSGFFIHLRAAERLASGKEAALPVAAFFRRRAHRLVPPYLLALAVTVLLDAGGRYLYPPLYHAVTGDAFLDDNFSRMGYSARSVAPALVMLPDSLGRQFGSNGPLWSLAFEVVYYLLYPAWLALRRRGWLVGYGLGGLGVAALALPLAPLGFLPMVLAHYPIWLAGAALAELVQGRLPAARFRWAWLAAAFLAALFLVVRQPPLPVLVAAYVLGGGATVLGCASLPRRVNRHLLHRFWEGVGQGSYTVYIVHFPALALLGATALRQTGHRPASGWPALGGACLVSTFCAGCYWVCERHFLHRKLAAPAPIIPAPTLTDALHPPEAVP